MTSLANVYRGWEGYQTSLVHAVTPLTREQLIWRAATDRRTLGEIVRHISLGRINWFVRMGAPGVDAVQRQVVRGWPRAWETAPSYSGRRRRYLPHAKGRRG